MTVQEGGGGREEELITASRFPILTISSGFNISLIEPNELRS